jgi:antitoxin ParD1/3/4
MGERRERAQAEIELIRKLWKEGIDSGPSKFETIDDITAEARKRHAVGKG